MVTEIKESKFVSKNKKRLKKVSNHTKKSLKYAGDGTKKVSVKIGIILAWVFGILFILGSVLGIGESILASIFGILAGIMLIPPTWRFLEKRGIKLKWWIILIIVLFLLSMMGVFIPEEKLNTDHNSENSQISQIQDDARISSEKLSSEDNMEYYNNPDEKQSPDVDASEATEGKQENMITKNGYTVSNPSIRICPNEYGYKSEWVCANVQIVSEEGFYEFMNFLYLYDDSEESYNRVLKGGGSMDLVNEAIVGAAFYLDCSNGRCADKSFYLVYVAEEGTAPDSETIAQLKEKPYTYVLNVGGADIN